MQVLPMEDSRLRPSYESTKPSHDFRILRIRSTCDVFVEMNHGPKDLPWRDAFWTMAETSLQEAEDLMLSLPYTQIRQHIYRLVPALDIVRVSNLVHANFDDASSVLVDVDLKNTVAREHHRYASADGGFPSRGFTVPPPPYGGGQGSPSSPSRLEAVKNELQATPREVLRRSADRGTATSATPL